MEGISRCSKKLILLHLLKEVLKISLTPQHGLTHSNNSLAVADEHFVFEHFVGWRLER